MGKRYISSYTTAVSRSNKIITFYGRRRVKCSICFSPGNYIFVQVSFKTQTQRIINGFI